MIDRNELDLYPLLPSVYRVRDADEGLVLQALLGLIAKQAQLVKTDIEGLWSDLFIETCADWVIPYIGDLVGNNAIHDVDQGRRADVANTIRFRRHKGTLSMLEQLAASVTGWGSHTVDFRELVAWTQNVNHVRVTAAANQVRLRPGDNPQPLDPNSLDAVGWVNVRDYDNVDRVEAAFETTSHTVDVRRPSGFQGRYGLRTIGFFLWRLRSYSVGLGTPLRVGPPDKFRYTFSPCGASAPLFTHAVPAVAEFERTTELNVPGPVRPAAFYFSPSDFYGAGHSFALYTGGAVHDPPDVICKDLSRWDAPPAGKVAIDVVRGRLVFGSDPKADVAVEYCYGFPDDIGGGPYDRRRAAATASDPANPDTVANPHALGKLIEVPSAGVATISQALAAWNPAVDRRAVIQVTNSTTYNEDLDIKLPVTGAGLVLQARNGDRPVVVGDIKVTAVAGTQLRLDGFLVMGSAQVDANLASLTLAHSTLVPGVGIAADGEPLRAWQPSLTVDPDNKSLALDIEGAICGRLALPFEMSGVTIRDSVLQATSNRALPALLSGNLSPFPALTSTNPTVLVTVGGDGPYQAKLDAVPNKLSQAASTLQSAIRSAGTNPELGQVRVLVAGNRLVVLPAAGSVVIEAASGDPTASQLRLDPGSGRRVSAYVGGPLNPFPQLTTLRPSVKVAMGGEPPVEAVFASVPRTVAQARDGLQAAIRATDPSHGVSVLAADNQLVVVSTQATAEISIGPTSTDPTSAPQLALDTTRPAFAADAGGSLFGPPATFERATVIGSVRAKQIDLASNALFHDRVTVQRTQLGCFRFTYSPPDSITPQRYHCQPDLAVEAGAASGVGPAFALAATVPSFTSTRYGDPAYCQLSAACPAAIAAGSDDGSEMGVYSRLQNPQREANLRLRLKEYLPFGLDPALIYVT